MIQTRCPGCATTFRVTPEQLKAKQDYNRALSALKGIAS